VNTPSQVKQRTALHQSFRKLLDRLQHTTTNPEIKVLVFPQATMYQCVASSWHQWEAMWQVGDLTCLNTLLPCCSSFFPHEVFCGCKFLTVSQSSVKMDSASVRQLLICWRAGALELPTMPFTEASLPPF
jgi:hypothetical protein